MADEQLTDADASAGRALQALLEVMRALRDPQRGCPWDIEQTFASIAPYTIEEAFEVADAIERKDSDALRQELGDLLFQVVFHARMAQEQGAFDFAAVTSGIVEKLRRRHPHVFAGGPQADWEALKATERADSGQAGVLDGVALSLPALTRASKLGQRAARANFDWKTADEVRLKVAEELAELDAADEQQESADRVAEELGDTLFALSQWARHRDIDPEAALRQANQKFARRVAQMERFAGATGATLSDLDPAQMELLWARAKQAEKGP